MQQPADVVVHPAIKHVPRSVVRDAHERIVRCGLGIVPVSSETEDKFEDAMEVTASSPLPEIARVLVRFNQVPSIIVNVNQGIVGANSTCMFMSDRVPSYLRCRIDRGLSMRATKPRCKLRATALTGALAGGNNSRAKRVIASVC
jgi:hypothetical protein